jgi:peptidoglycan hydrolase CwlO-like protein
MTNLDRDLKVLSLWGDINNKHKQIEDLQLRIGKLKDEILILQREITEVQVDDLRSGTHSRPERL